MLGKVLLSCALLLTALEPFLTHPLSHSTGMSYAGPVEEQLVSPGDLSFSEQNLLSQETAGLAYPSLLTGDNNGQGIRTAGFVPSDMLKEVLLEKSLVNPLSTFLGGRKQYRKRGGNTECFWKYCV